MDKNYKIIRFLINKGYSCDYIRKNKVFLADINDDSWGGKDKVPKPTERELLDITHEEAEEAIIEEQLNHREDKIDSKLAIYLVARLYKKIRPGVGNLEIKDEIKKWIRQGLISGDINSSS